MTIDIKTERIEDLLFCETKPVLEIKIEYPQIYGKISGAFERTFNSFYLKYAIRNNTYARKDFYKKASDTYKNSEKTGFPFNFMTFESTVHISSIKAETVSLYFDTYKYEGGAHGMTLRTSESWSTKNGMILPLGSFFVKGFNYTYYIKETISRLISEDLKGNDSIYYKNAPERCKRFFDEKRYYLSDTGFIFFYPSYSIAPYCAGIRTFEMSFEDFGNKLKYRPERMT